MAQFQSEIELRVKVLDKELDQLEKRIAKVANPFTASGGARNDKRIRAAKQVQRAELNLVQQAVEAEDRLRETKAQKRIQTNLRRVRFLRDQRIKAAKDVAAAEKRFEQDAVRRAEARNKKLGSGIQSGLISAAFPLLTGGGGAEAIFGGVGGVLGSVLGGELGGFAGGIAGSAIGKLITDADNLNKELAALNARLGATGTEAAIAADDISELARQLNVTKEEAADLASELVGVADATAIQDVAKAFGPVGGASTFEAIAQAGLDEKSALEAIDSLRGQIGLKAAEQLTKVLETQGAVALQAALLDEVLRKSQDVTTETAKQVTIWDRINFLVQEYLLGIASASSPQGLADQRAGGIEPPEIGVLDSALTNYEAYLKKRNALNERYKPKTGGRSGTNEEQRIQQRLASLQAETAAVQRRAEIESKISQARIAEDQSLVNRLTLERELSAIREREEKAAARVTDVRLQQAIAEKASAEAAAARSRYADKEAERIAAAEQSYTQQIEVLNLQLVAAQAITREEKEQADLQLRLLRLRNANKDLSAEQLQNLEEATRKLFAATNLGPLESYIKNTSAALADTEMQMTKIVQTIEGQLASGITNFFTGIIDGSKSAEEAFADMLKGMGQALIQQASVMIAQYIAIGIARAFAGMGGGGGTFGSGASAPISDIPFSAGGIGYRANGGPVDSATPYVVGERGPELFVPSSSGRIVNNADSRAALDRYTPTSSNFYSSNLNITTGPVMQMDNKDYISREDFERGLRQASDDGAKRGEAMTLRRLKNSRSTRTQLGM